MTAVTPLQRADTADADSRGRLADLLFEVARTIDPGVVLDAPSRLDGDPRLDAVRDVLLNEQLQVLAHLQRTIDDPERLAAAICAVLPHAVSLAGARDERLGEALAPTMERATQASIRKNPGNLINILYPLMGPAIRKSIAERLDDTLQGLNQALRFAFSWRGLKWRIEAMRSGTSFGDVVLKHTLVYRVEHVFLIHRKAGLLLEHLAAADAAARDPQLVSGMLTAIQDFVRDSFDDEGSAAGAIDSLRLGDLLIWCEAGPQAYLAAVIRGNPPESLRAQLRDTLADIHRELRSPLEDYDGDAAPLGDLAARLDPCLKQQVQAPERRWSIWMYLLPLVLVFAGGWWWWQSHQESRRVAAYVATLRQQPGIVVTGVEHEGGLWRISGLRDPLAVDTRSLMGRANLDSDSISEHWEPYVALSPGIVLRRLKASLPPLPSVRLKLDGDIVRFEGGAPPDWIEKARALARGLPAGAPRVDLSGVTDVEDPEYLRLRDAIQSALVYFDSGAPNPAVGQERTLDEVAENTRAIIDVAHRLGFSVNLAIIGHADSTGKQTSNLGLSIARAEVVRSLLRSRGIEPSLLSVRGTGTLEPLTTGEAPTDMSQNRAVSFTVNTSE
jgi:OOP family OmpA-OmpF porin